MTNRSKAKGTVFESAVVEYIRANGFRLAERRALNGSTDRGDISGVPGIVWECKNCVTTTLGPWVVEAKAEAANAGVPVGVVVHKRKGKGNPADAFVSMDLATFCRLAGDPVIEEATA